MYKVASNKQQGRVDRVTTVTTLDEAEQMTNKERLEMLRVALAKLEAKIVTLPEKSQERKALGKQQFAIQAEITELKGMDGKRRELGGCFIETAMRMLDRPTYEEILSAAKHMHDTRCKTQNEANLAKMKAML